MAFSARAFGAANPRRGGHARHGIPDPVRDAGPGCASIALAHPGAAGDPAPALRRRGAERLASAPISWRSASPSCSSRSPIIQRFILFLGHPLYAVAVVLAGFLVFAGVGSAAAPRLQPIDGSQRPGPLGALEIAVIGDRGDFASLYLVGLPPLFEALIALPDRPRSRSRSCSSRRWPSSWACRFRWA